MPIIRDILYGATTRGASLSEMCQKLEISLDELNDSEKYLDFERAYKSWEVALSETDDKSLGLHLGETTNPSILGLIGHLMQSSPTLISAFQSVCHYGKVATDMFYYGWEETGNEFILTFQPTEAWMRVSEKSARQAVEQAMAGTLNVFKLLVGNRKLSGRLRKDMALKLIHHSDHKIETIAEMLGYSEASAFRRAFKNWN